MLKFFGAIFILSLLSAAARAEIKMEQVNYQQGDTKLIGWVAYDDAIKDPRPGVLVFPEWWGLTDYPKHRAQQLAQLGYVAFAADMYGNGQTTDQPADAGKLAGALHGDIALTRARANAALATFRQNPHVDPKKIAAIGYCLGGTCALELARGGADIVGVVTFHGGLATTTPADARNIKAKILVCTGGDDTSVPPAQISAFEDEMRAAGVNWEVIVFSGAHHAFTNPDADKFKLPNIAYNEQADHRSWEAMKGFFEEVFQTTGGK